MNQNNEINALNLKLGRETTEGVLDAVPRSLGRSHLPEPYAFNGFDMWNAYEVSFLLPSQKPVVYHMRAQYDAHSPAIVESKSFKLFLNAQNNRVFQNLEAFEAFVAHQLSQCVGSQVTDTDLSGTIKACHSGISGGQDVLGRGPFPASGVSSTYDGGGLD